MKPTPTPEMIDAFIIAKESADRRLYGFHNLGRHFILDGTTEVWFTASDDYEVGHAAMMAQLERLRMEAALSAALSVPAEAVVGEPVGYVSAPELVQLKMGASCVDLFREPQPGGIDFAPVYAAPSASERDAVGEPVAAFHVKVKGWGEELCFTEDGAQSLIKRLRRTKGQDGEATITPLYATLPNEALERSEQATFDIAARLLKERDALASRISQQDAELDRLRREVEEASAKIKSLVRQRDELKEEADELVVRQYEVSAQAADISRLRGALEQLVSHAERHKLDKGLISGKLYEAARDALNGVQDPLAEARKAALIEAAEIAENITSAECREIISEEKWVDMTDDYGEHIGQMKQGACFRLNFRKGIAAALRAKAEETRT